MKKLLLPLATALCTLAISAEVNAQATTARVPLFEVFTSSTCPPCKPGNAIYEGIVSTKPAADYVSIKYQQDFPGAGDPYGTSETVSRRSYYAINSIPRMEIDGGWDQNAQSFSDALYTQYRNVPATYTLSGTYTVTNKVVTARANFKALTAGTNTKLYVVVLETRTTLNVKNNGETEFFNVARKMMPNQNGVDISSYAVGTQKSITQSYTFPEAHRLPTNYSTKIDLATENSVEDFSKLIVVGFVQGSNKQVYQAANFTKSTSTLNVAEVSTINSYKLFPVPANNQLNISFEMKNADQVSASLVNMAGQVVATQSNTLTAGASQMSINTSSLAAGNYTMILVDGQNNVQATLVTIAH